MLRAEMNSFVESISPGFAASFTDEETFNLIVRFAKTGDRRALKTFLAKGFCVGIRLFGMSAVESLAKEGDVDAVYFLLDYFGASLNCAVRGFAHAGNVDQVEKLFTMGADMGFAAEGYAAALHDKLACNLLDRGAGSYHIVYGYAQVNAIDKLQQFIQRINSDDSNFHIICDALYKGFAKARNYSMLSEFDGSIQKFSRAQVMACAEAGLFSNVREMLRNTHDGAIDNAVEMYAKSGYHAQVEDLLSQGAHIRSAIEGYAQAGAVRRVMALLHEERNNESAYMYAYQGFVNGGLVAEANECFQSGVRKFQWDLAIKEQHYVDTLPDYRFSEEGKAMYHDDRVCLRILSLTNNPFLRKILVKDLEAHNSHHAGKYRLLAKQAQVINRWMTEYDMGYSQALRLSTLTKSQRVWCLQGSQIAAERKENDESDHPFPVITYEMFLSITAQMLELSIKNSELVIAALHERKMAESIRRNTDKYVNGFFSRQKVIKENEIADKKFNPVLRFN